METYIIVGIAILFFVFLVIKSKDIDKEPEKKSDNQDNQKELQENTVDEKEIIDEEEIIEAEAKNEKFPYILSDMLLTSKEQKFYNTLKPIAEKYNYTILCKMRLADIIKVPKDTYESLRWFNYIKAKHIDFLVCDSNFKIIALIEVDDYTHNFDNRKKRDKFVNEIFKQLNVKLLHYKTWTAEQLEADLKT